MTMNGLTGLDSALILRIATSPRLIQGKLTCVLNLRATCKSLQAVVDETVSFGLPFLKSIKRINLASSVCQDILRQFHWLSVYRTWVHTPPKIVLLDYSESMDKLAPPHSCTHLSIALDILKQLFVHQQDQLRTRLIVYVFGKDHQKYRIHKSVELESLITNITKDEVSVDRKSTSIQNMMKHLVESKNRNEKSLDIDLISDNDMNRQAIRDSLEALDDANERVSKITLNFIPTSQSNNTQTTIATAAVKWNESKRKDRLELHLTDAQSFKRQKIEVPAEVEELSPYNSPTSSPFPDFNFL
jgi:hypothetical protein